MSLDHPVAEFEFASGAARDSRLTLYANRLVHRGADSTEIVPLAHMAAVSVAFERDARKLNWAVILLLVALPLALMSGPLHGWMAEAAAKVGEHSRNESVDAMMLGTFRALAAMARLMLPLAGLLAAGAVALLVFFRLGVTTLTLSFAAVERRYAVRGRNPLLVEFADLVAGSLATRKDSP